MKRFPILGVLLLIPAILLFGVVGCTSKSGDKDKGTGDKGVAADKGGDKGDKDKGAKAAIKGALEATVTGTVKIKGKAPEMMKITALSKHGDAKICAMGDEKDQTWIVGADGTVANVVVILAPPSNMKFKIDDELNKLIQKKTVELDQPYCQYEPHVAGVYGAVQKLKAKNSAAVNHNVKLPTPGNAGTVDKNLPPKANDGAVKDTGEIDLSDLNNETLLTAQCSVHPWMNAKIAVFKHPYFAVTDEKGKFSIQNVPVDAELTVYIWHESMGDSLKSKIEQKKMTFKKGDNSLGELEISAK